MFRDVAGCDEVVEEVREFVEFLKNPERFARVGARMPAGVLLHGPPGTGKTLLAKALAAEAGVDFFAASGAEFVERYVGVGASRVRELFTRGRKAEGGAVVFIDELDALGRRRSGGGGQSGNDEYEHTLNQLLIEMDGFTGNERLVCVGATNRLDVLDPALLRPGRFSRQVSIELPSAEGRLAILRVHARGRPLAREVDLAEIAELTAGSSGADLREMLNEGAIMAAREGRAEVTRADLAEGRLRALAGPARRSSPLTAEERVVVARHEAGHALVAEYCPTQDATQRLSITPRGRAGGLAVIARRDRALQSARHVHEQLMVMLGGRAAEAVVYGDVSSGAADDLQRANALARHAVMSLGFSTRAGQLTATAAGQNMPLSDTTRRVADEEVERMIAEAYRDAVAMARQHRTELGGCPMPCSRATTSPVRRSRRCSAAIARGWMHRSGSDRDPSLWRQSCHCAVNSSAAGAPLRRPRRRAARPWRSCASERGASGRLGEAAGSAGGAPTCRRRAAELAGAHYDPRVVPGVTEARDPTPVLASPVRMIPTDSGEEPETGVALCLSGGGYRAMLFHLGVIWRLREAGWLERLDRVSSVSGGSITAAVLALAPAGDFEESVVRPLRALARRTLDWTSALEGALLPGSISERLADAYGEHLFGTAVLGDLPSRPDFVINATNVSSGALARASSAPESGTGASARCLTRRSRSRPRSPARPPSRRYCRRTGCARWSTGWTRTATT